ncbi:phospholipase DDHD2-like [Limulus polyphemus]|uniref:Phospholipase DDHD2-like n=1 Tax=Limulus polyphemus TaxID=6850 RepID=A0ABM1B738_LIMPO|nr:phospholipase DDHD2-like [Limulus polyphemus]
MAGRGSGLGKGNDKNVASLLLQPPGSGFSWDQMAGSAILLPVSQSGEMDSFVGQSLLATEQQVASPTKSIMQPPVPSQRKDSGGSGGMLSQLQQPLRPPQAKLPTKSLSPMSSETSTPSDSPRPSPAPTPISDTTVGPPPISTVPLYSGPTNIPPHTVGSVSDLSGPPPTGPAQNFRRQSPMRYAPTPGLYGKPNVVPGNFGPPPVVDTAPPLVPSSGSQEQNISVTTSPILQLPQTSQMPYGAQTQAWNLPVGFITYQPVQPHWFYEKEIEKRKLWIPFSIIDSLNLEEAYKRDPHGSVVATDGGRYDVVLGERLKKSVYWEEEPHSVKRCTWFYKQEGQNKFVPYEEDIASKLEEEFKYAVSNNSWNRRIELPDSELIIMYSPNSILHTLPTNKPDEWGNVIEIQRPRVVKRGAENFELVDYGESTQIDHLVFVIHGVGAICDLRCRSVVECVDDFRSLAINLLQSHFKEHVDEGQVGRVEFLPVSWHSTLHSDATGIDKQMKTITLSSIPKLRNFTNDTLLDILFYTSPVYCQTIVDTVGSELNRLYHLFCSRNSTFQGKVSVSGHSLGSLILFDILDHQMDQSPLKGQSLPDVSLVPSIHSAAVEQQQLLSEDFTADQDVPATLESVFEKLGLVEYVSKFEEEKIDLETLHMCSENDIKEMGLPMGPRKKLLCYLQEREEKKEEEKHMSLSKPSEPVPVSPVNISQMIGSQRTESVTTVNYHMGVAGTGQPSVIYPKLDFAPSCFFALGSPISMFLAVRGIETIGEDYRLPTCPWFFNIFHPFDPVAYRMETLIDPNMAIKPVQIPHHKGRKRMHLEIKDSLTKLGYDLKQKLVESLRYTWNSINEFARAHRSTQSQIEAVMDQVVQEEVDRQRQESDDLESTVSASDVSSEEIQIGQLNGGRRIDYVLQEKPIESFNEYLFALGSHACYWESEDTVLMILRELYALQGIRPKRQGPPTPQKIPLYNPAIARPPLPPLQSSTASDLAAPPAFASMLNTSTAPLQFSQPPPVNKPVGPPPLSGFVSASPFTKK